MKWNKTIEQVPKSGEKVLVCYRGFYRLLMWNSHDDCWDDWEWGDYFCDKEEVEYWMSLPEMPKI